MTIAAIFVTLAALLMGAQNAPFSIVTPTNQNSETARPLPSNPEAERSVLGAILLDNHTLPVASQYVQAEDFFLDQHRRIFRYIQALGATGSAIDLVTLTEELHRRGELEGAGGAAYLAQLVDGVPRVSNVEHYARIVKEKSMLRNLAHAAQAIQQRALEADEKSDAVIEAAVKSILELQTRQGEASLPKEWSEAVWGAAEEAVRAIREPEKVARFLFNIPTLDYATSGFRREDIVLIVGQSSHGKSILAMQLATACDDAEFKGLIFSAEMSKEALAKRELAHAAGIPMWYLRRPEKIHDKEGVVAKLQIAAASESKRSMQVVDSGITPARIWSLARMKYQHGGLDFVIVDYDQLVIREGIRRKAGRVEDQYAEQAQFMTDALALAKELKICFVLLCQPRKVSDEVARGKAAPRLEEIFGSSSVANTAHHVLWIIRKFFQKGYDEKYEDQAKCYILKARNDRAQHVDLRFDHEMVRFEDAPKDTESVPGEEE